MKVTVFEVEGLALLHPERFGDDRGWFSETWSARRMAEAGLNYDFVQDNHAYSRDAGVLRGLHFQRPPSAQAKLVRCTRGRIFDVAVDIRQGSPSYGRWAGVDLDAETGAMLMVPRGFLHGYLTLTPDTEVIYKVDGFYDREADGGVRWDDPAIAIRWPLEAAGVSAPVLSAKDRDAPLLNAIDNPFIYGRSV